MSVEVDGKNVFTKEMANVFNAEVIECPDCVFEFSTIHELNDSEGLYECPACKEANLEVLVEQYKKALEEIAYHVNTPIGAKEDYKNTSYHFIDIAKRGLGY